MKAKLKEILTGAAQSCIDQGLLPAGNLPEWQLEPPKTRQHGDYAGNLALKLAPPLKMAPRAVAEMLVSRLPDPAGLVERAEIAGPGFINLFVTDKCRALLLQDIHSRGEDFGRSTVGEGRRVQVEFVSANPTGPLTIGHGRQAVLGDAIGRLLEATGHKVTREYYFNDAGRQMRLLAESTRARYLEGIGRAGDFPKEGYLGDYVLRIACKIFVEHGDTWAGADLDRFKAFAQEALFAEIRATLERLGVAFDVYFNETSLYADGSVQSVIDSLRKEKLAYEKDGALWFTGSAFGLDKDRVIVKSTGEPTYRLPDMAYHINKLSRGFDWIVDIFGADHESTYRDVLAGLTALGHDVSRIRVLIHQFVTLLKDGKQVRMGKREGNYVTLDDLMGEVGVDAVRFFFLQRRHDAHLEFDTDLARRESEENPVYYVQYAHARIASLLSEAAKQGIEVPATSEQAHPERLVSEEERELLGQLAEYPDLVERSALALEPHRLVFYLLDLARNFHAYYNAHRIISDDSSLTVARLGLVSALARVLRAGLSIIGVNAPERM